MRRGDLRHRFRRALRDDAPAAISAVGSEVNQIIGAFDDIEIVFDDDQRMAAIQQLPEAIEEFRDVGERRSRVELVQSPTN